MKTTNESDNQSHIWYSRKAIRSLIFGSDTVASRAFDVGLLIAIVASVSIVAWSSLPSSNQTLSKTLYYLEWFFTILFTIEYALRIYCLKRPMRYIFSIWGIIDLIAILPTYLYYWFAGFHVLIVFRLMRMLRVFKILHLTHYVQEGNQLLIAIKSSLPKILVFMLFIVILVTILGSIMYAIESDVNPAFSSIPRAIYWAVITLTIVGYGDITPSTGLGQALSTIIMLLGYAIIAVPTGIISTEMVAKKQERERRQRSEQTDLEGKPRTSFDTKQERAHTQSYCASCGKRYYKQSDRFCSRCGTALLLRKKRKVMKGTESFE